MSAADPSEATLIREASWLSEDADRVRLLLETPGECLRPPENEKSRYLIEVGRAAFRSPLLFGGPAARSGLSCNSCHRDGRGNNAFFVQGLSGAPGTADVTSALFSKTRGDGVFNPVVIPDLIDVGDKSTFGASAPAHSLQEFVQNAVVDEFQGAPPSGAVVDGVSAYLASLDSNYCPTAPTRRNAADDLEDSERALRAAYEALESGDPATADFLVLSAQHGLARLHERFPGNAFRGERNRLQKLASEIAGLRNEIGSSQADALASMMAVLVEIDAYKLDLAGMHARSLYDAAELQRALGQHSAAK